MKQLELTLTERLAFAQLLSTQKADGRGAARVRPFHRVILKIRLDAEEKKALRYKEYQAPGPQGGLATYTSLDMNLAVEFPAKKVFLETPDAEACAELLKGNTIDIATGDIEWIDSVLPQLEGKEVAMVPAEA